MNMVTNNVDLGNVILSDSRFEDAALTFDAEGVAPEGLILGRVTATGSLAPYDSDATDGSETPTHVLTYEVSASAAGDVAVRAMIGGSVRTERLVVGLTGDPGDVTEAELDLLRQTSIIPVLVEQLAALDNQPD